MEVLAVLGAWALPRLCPILPSVDNTVVNSACGVGDIVSILEPRLSSSARIILPGSTEFNEVTDRWSWYGAPSVSAAVEVATENDVAETIKYANANGYSFIAKNAGHGAIASSGKLQNGLEIWLNKLNAVTISPEGDTATFGGGVLSKQVSDTLWAAGKQTITNACECTSLLGPELDGGHGFLQGKYGLISDQFVSMRVALADGSIETVSAHSNPDLWWAMQGAGHNFGIVTSVTSKIYNVDGNADEWFGEFYVFTHDKVEAIYRAANQLRANKTDLMIFSVFKREPKVDPENPVVLVFVLKQGNPGIGSRHIDLFRDIGPVSIIPQAGTIRDIPKWVEMDMESPTCQKMGSSYLRYPVNIQSYNITAQRMAFDAFAAVTSVFLPFNTSFMIFESYAAQTVKAIPPDSTAFPHHEDDILTTASIAYEPALAPDSIARKFGESLRDIIHLSNGKRELHAYVNYAAGDKALQSWYEYDP